MKKSEFTENPAPVELEGTVLRICFDTEEVDQVINNGEEGQESETRKVYLAYVIRVSNPFTLENVTKALLKEGFDEFKAVAVAAEALLTTATRRASVGIGKVCLSCRMPSCSLVIILVTRAFLDLKL